MFHEVEVCAVLNDSEGLKGEILRRGGTFEKGAKQRDIYFNHPSRDFMETDEALRLRNEDGAITAAYKGPRLTGASKARKEQECGVSDFETMKAILISLGFKEAGEVVKQRETYLLEGVNICIDEVEGLGGFAEFEVFGEDIDASEKMLLSLARDLGCKAFTTESYLELLLKKNL